MTIEKISPNEISVVVQGAIDIKNTFLCLNSIRKHLPGAEIILSTWEGSNVDDLDYDKVVFNKDPGGFKDKISPHFHNNILRHIISTQEGLSKCDRKYTLKIRSDLCLLSAKFLKYFDAFPYRDKNYAFMEHRVISCSFFSKKYLQHNKLIHPVPFHLSDWLAFGLTSDIKTLYNINLPAEKTYGNYFYNHPYHGEKINLMGCSHQYAPEQYILYSCIKKFYPEYTFQNYMDYNDGNITFSEKIIANNFIILSPQKFKLVCLKEKTGSDTYKKWCRIPLSLPRMLYNGLYRYDVFLKDYRKYCDNKFKIPFTTKIGVLLYKIFGRR